MQKIETKDVVFSSFGLRDGVAADGREVSGDAGLRAQCEALAADIYNV